MNRLQEKHPLAIRWLHWISFPLLFLMIWSGLMIYWANDIYRVGWGNTTLIHFFPDWVYQLLGVKQRLAWGMAVHFFFMWFFAFNGILYVTYLLVSGEWRILLPDRHSFRDAILVTLHDLHLRKTPPPSGQVQRSAEGGVYRCGTDGGGQSDYGSRYLQTGATGVADESLRRL